MTQFIVAVWKRTGDPRPPGHAEERTMTCSIIVQASSAWAAVITAAERLGLSNEDWNVGSRPRYVLRPKHIDGREVTEPLG